MSMSRMLFGVLWLSSVALAAHELHGRACTDADACEAPAEHDVLLLQRKVRVDGQQAADHDGAIESLMSSDGWWDWTSASATDGTGAGNAIDRSWTTSYMAPFMNTGARVYLTLDLGVVRPIHEIEITWVTCFCSLSHSMELEYSLNPGDPWEPVPDVDIGGMEIVDSGPPPPQGEARIYPFPPLHGRLFRLSHTNAYHNNFELALLSWQVIEVRTRTTTTTTTPRDTTTTTRLTTATRSTGTNRLTSCGTTVQQVNPGNWQPEGTPYRVDCNYVATNTISSVLAVDCGNPCEFLDHMASAVRAGNARDRHPARVAGSIIDRMKSFNGLYFANPNMERDLTIGGLAFELVGDLHASFVGGGNMYAFMEQERIRPQTYSQLRSEISRWTAQGDTRRIGKAVASGALDLVGAVSGPVGVGVSLASAALSFWQSGSQSSVMQSLAEAILAEVNRMINAQAYAEQRDRTQGYLAAFTEELDYALQVVEDISVGLPEHGGIMQFIFLSALQSDLITTRYEWAPFWGEHSCYGECNTACAGLRNFAAQAMPTLAVMHLSLLHEMAIVAASNNRLAHEVMKKFYQNAVSYLHYINRFVVTRSDDPFFYHHTRQEEGGDWMIIVCPASGGSDAMIELDNLLNGWNSGGLKWKFHNMLFEAAHQGWVSYGEIALSLLQERGSGTTQEGMTRLSLNETSLVKAGPVFDSPPKMEFPPRSTWEAEFHEICGPGLACFRDEMNAEQLKSHAQRLKALAHKLGKHLRGESQAE